MTWSGDYSQAAARAAEAGVDVELHYSAPKEGVNIDYDTMAILKDAKNVDEAHEFINYMLRPDVIAKVTNEIGYANANKAATPGAAGDPREPGALSCPRAWPGSMPARSAMPTASGC
jgi:putrescine transport system substrate-binding protein